MSKKVVLAFSGGLDTSFCVPYLKNEHGYEVHTVMVNTGGFQQKKRKLSKNAPSHSVRLLTRMSTLLTHITTRVSNTSSTAIFSRMPHIRFL